MKIRKKKGFTLIELMIVLAIIAILAVVLIPKAGIFKSQAKNAGVITNVNTVRAYLETKVTNSAGNPGYLSASDLEVAFGKSFDFSSATGTGTNTDPCVLISNATSSTKEVIPNPITPGAVSIIIASEAPSSETAGSVVIIASTTSGYTVYGVDKDGNETQKITIK